MTNSRSFPRKPLTSGRSQVPRGARYFVETEAWPDDPKTGNLRVMVSIYDDRSLLRSIFPLTSGFIVAPDGRFVDE